MVYATTRIKVRQNRNRYSCSIWIAWARNDGVAYAATHIRSKNVVFVGILDEVTDDYGRKQYALQIEGSKTGRELPGTDEVITMAVMAGDNGPYRAFICGALNEWGYPAKDRSGRLDTLEEPHLGKLLNKMSVANHRRKDP